MNSFKGNLKDISIVQLLNLVRLAQKSSMLVIEGENSNARLAFQRGKLAYARLGEEEIDLATVLRRENKISQNLFRILQEKPETANDIETGLFLTDACYTTQETILTCLEHHYADVTRSLFTWLSGFFEFFGEEAIPRDKILVELELQNLIVEGTQQLRAWKQVAEEIPSLDVILKFCEHPDAKIRSLNLSKTEWQLVSYVHPNNTIKQIGQTLNMDDSEIRRVVFRLIQNGIVELVRPGGLTLPFNPPTHHPPDKKEQKSIFSKILHRNRPIS